ncbi:NTP transferase domain-containing protein [Lentiprolixibacter aurantiacus]|uniref:Probable molybdenum cofactor guanylyltransferase n=1 Tax=Lentiprolixibacter aurantiacus TaxID=2993939 RepID=A0AAE3MMK3_9FLAO|nr:NTP transferase domain-containing protein [Lentiprolixibacter aurantiacus]MCX2719602.1 NTP transferase domain-containing protein [Lentiprolixibacter aurantiacus]
MENKSNSNIPPLYGLVLAGGKSTRMGQDKSLLEYHGIPQADYLYSLLEKICNKTFMSLRADQQNGNKGVNAILDEDRYRGPFNGILSAHNSHPEAAWLVLACDLPLIDEASLNQLIEARDPEFVATAMATRKSGLPEPLVAIWEPRGLNAAREYLKTAESSCPRKFLIRNNSKLVNPEKDQVLLNANNPEEYQEALTIIQSI